MKSRSLFKEPPTTVARVDRQWRAEWMQEQSDGALNAGLLMLIDEADPKAVSSRVSAFRITTTLAKVSWEMRPCF